MGQVGASLFGKMRGGTFTAKEACCGYRSRTQAADADATRVVVFHRANHTDNNIKCFVDNSLDLNRTGVL